MGNQFSISISLAIKAEYFNFDRWVTFCMLDLRFSWIFNLSQWSFQPNSKRFCISWESNGRRIGLLHHDRHIQSVIIAMVSVIMIIKWVVERVMLLREASSLWLKSYASYSNKKDKVGVTHTLKMDGPMTPSFNLLIVFCEVWIMSSSLKCSSQIRWLGLMPSNGRTLFNSSNHSFRILCKNLTWFIIDGIKRRLLLFHFRAERNAQQIFNKLLNKFSQLLKDNTHRKNAHSLLPCRFSQDFMQQLWIILDIAANKVFPES